MQLIKIKIFASLVIIFSTTINTSAIAVKRSSITGIIIDKSTNNPIEYANLVLFSSNDSSLVNGAVSLSNGSFRIEDIDYGLYYLLIQFIGYKTHSIGNIEINSDNKNIHLGFISISPSSIELQETEIIGTADYITFKIDKTIVNVQEQIGAEGGPIVDALSGVPSVQVDGGGNVSLRGSSSFTLLIDGKPSVLDASDALNQIPSSSVEKIEVITNPSVKYDSDGTSGIINLLMKKQRRIGTSGQATLALATGDKYSGNIMLNQRSHKLQTRFGVTYSKKRKQTDSKDFRDSYFGDSILSQSISSKRDIHRENYKFNGGLGWSISKTDILNFDLELGSWGYDRQINSKIVYDNNYDSYGPILSTNDDFQIINRYIKGDIGYNHNFSKQDHHISTDFYYSHLQNSTPNKILQYGLDNDYIVFDSILMKLDSKSNRNHIRFNIDYSLPISDKLNFEIGYQIDNKKSSSDYSYNIYSSIGNSWVGDSLLSANSDFRRNINSLYGIANTSFFGFSLKLGLKIELINRSLWESNSNISSPYEAINIFPSLHLARSLKNDQQISLSYSRRVNRPNQWMLIPAPRSTGRNMLQLGNPELLPDFTNSFELGYTKQNDILLFNTQLYARITTNSISSSITDKEGIFYQSYENLKSEISSGIEVMGNVNVRKWWRINLTANAYYYKLTGSLLSGYQINNKSYTWNGSFRTTFIVKRKTYLEFLAIYYGPSILAQGKTKDFYYFDFFIKRNFFNRSLTIALRSHNTFDTGIYIEDTEGINYYAHTWFKYEGPTFMITLTYRLKDFKRHRSKNNLDMNFDSGLDH